MDAKKKKEFLKQLQQLERQKHQPMNEMALIDKTNALITLLIRVSLEDAKES